MFGTKMNTTPNPQVLPVVTYLNFYSYFCLIPYKFEWNPSSFCYVIQTSSIKKFLCVLLHLAGIAEGLSWAISFFFSEDRLTSGLLLLLWFSNYTSAVALCSNFVAIVWLKTDELSKFVNKVESLVFSSESNAESKLEIAIVCSAPLLVFSSYNFLRDSDSGTYTLALQIFPVIKDYAILKKLLETCGSIGSFVASVYMGILQSIALTVKLASDGYRESLTQIVQCQTNAKESLRYVIKAGEMQREMTSIVNSIIGSGLILNYIIGLAHFTILPHFSIDSTEDIGEKIYMAFYLLSLISFWVLACEYHYRIKKSTKQWLHEIHLNSNGLSLDTKMALLSFQYENESNPISISCRFFAATYGFLVSMIGIICTYSTIIFQLKHSS